MASKLNTTLGHLYNKDILKELLVRAMLLKNKEKSISTQTVSEQLPPVPVTDCTDFTLLGLIFGECV